MFKLNSLFALLIAILVVSCNNDDDSSNSTQTVSNSDVINNYAELVYESYLDSYNQAVIMQTAINNFVDNPTEANFTSAKNAWLAAREPYGQTEAYRECSGPIDTDNSANTPWGLGNEGQLNAWPLDEGYIDYVQAGTEGHAGDHAGGIIAGTDPITESLLTNANESGSGSAEKNISTGWHAIEFLLWGQDNTNPNLYQPGQRLYTDYTTATNAARRGEYLKVVTTILVNDLQDLVNTWNTGGTYRTVFSSLEEDVALQQLINGAFFIAGDELSSERIIAPVDSTDGITNSGQEDEHSCFSDNTHRDIFGNAQGVYNVVFGEYGFSVSGASFYDLVKQADPIQAQKLLDASNEAMLKVNIIANNAKPFDYLITQETSASTSGPVMQSVVALQAWADEISASATAIGINL